MKFFRFSLLPFLLALTLTGCGGLPLPLTPKQRAASAAKAQEMELDDKRLMKASLDALMPVLKAKGYGKPDESTFVVLGPNPGMASLLGGVVGPDKSPHQLDVDFKCTKHGEIYTVSLWKVAVDNKTIWLPEGHKEIGGHVIKLD